MKRVIWIACAVAAAASFLLCAAVLSRASGIHEVASDGTHLFDAHMLIQRRALFGIVVSALSFGAICLGQLAGTKRSQIASLTMAFVLMSVLGAAISVSTLHQFN